MESIRIGIVGLGGICRDRHVPGFQKIDGVEIVSVVNRSGESSRAAADAFGIPVVDDSWEAMVARDDLDAIVIGTWPYKHRDISIAALASGKHVFCQARMAMNRAEAEEMIGVSRAKDKVAMLCPVPFGLSIDKTMVKILANGTLGEVRLVRVQSFTDLFAADDALVNWRKDHRLSGLNMHTLGMYIEVMHRWFGMTESVAATSDIFVEERPEADGESLSIRIPDQILANAHMENGVPVQYTMNAAVPNGADRIEIYGSERTLVYEVFTNEFSWVNMDGTLSPVAIAEGDGYDIRNWRVEEDFIRAIREPDFDYYPSFEDGLQYMKVVQAIYDSIEGGKAVTIG
ncbi:MAG: Gfo/Idh/MocA family oxidoreductase [Candidatus Hydrogenedentota bacterium]